MIILGSQPEYEYEIIMLLIKSISKIEESHSDDVQFSEWGHNHVIHSFINVLYTE